MNFAGLKADARKLNVTNDVELMQLNNGMFVALAPDNRSNLVAVDMRYKVGAGDDPAGRRGLAHLVEHLTFQGPGNGDGGSIFDELSTRALSFNAFTDQDVTHYVSVGLANQLPRLLELEARRLEGACAKIPDAMFVRERDVVLEEEAQRATPAQALMLEVKRAVWGPQHPYAHPIGSRDVAQTTQAEACAFFAAHYAPKAAVLVVTGNFDPKVIRSTIGHRFVGITRDGAATARRTAPAELAGTRSEHTGPVDHPLALVVLPAPAWGDEGEALHELVMNAFSADLAALDTREPWVRSTAVGYSGVGYQRVAVAQIEVDAPGRLDDAVAAVFRIGQDVLQDEDHDGNADDNDDPDDRDVAHYLGALRGRLQTATITDADTFWGHGRMLADYLTYTSNFDFAFTRMRATDAITGTSATGYAKRLFRRERSHVALVTPSNAEGGRALTVIAASTQDYDLPAWRAPADPAEADQPIALTSPVPAPAIEVIQLTNGLRVLMYAAPRSPAFSARMVYPVGRAAEPGDQAGVADLAVRLLEHDFDHAYARHEVDKINWAMRLGTQITRNIDDDATVVTSRGLSMFADWHLWRLAWLLDSGIYSPATLTTYRKEFNQLDDEDGSPAGRLLLAQLYGARHPYAAAPPSGGALAALTEAQLTAWRRRALTPSGATLVVCGGFDPVEMHRHIVDLFGELPRSSAPPPPPVPAAVAAPGPTWIGRRTKDDSQVRLFLSLASTSDRIQDRAAREVLSELVNDRLRGIRESLGASYGVSVGYDSRAAGSTLDISASLDPVRAPAAAAAVMQSLASLRADPRSAAADFVRARKRLLSRALASSVEAGDVGARLEDAVRTGRDPLAIAQDASAIAKLTLADVSRLVAADLDPARMVVLMTGRHAPLKATLDAAGATDVRWFDE
ncbi:MAG: insulinase family protein [Kofleriaceae bacterium]